MLKSILIVEDSPSMSKVLAAQMQELGVKHIVCAADGLEALAEINR